MSVTVFVFISVMLLLTGGIIRLCYLLARVWNAL